jgi:hypothetical protein
MTDERGPRGPYKKRVKQVELPEGLPELANSAQVAKYLHVTEAGLAQLRFRGAGPRFIKVGRRVLYRWADVLEYLEENTRTGTATEFNPPAPFGPNNGRARPGKRHRSVAKIDPLDEVYYRFCFNCGHPSRDHAMQPHGIPYGVGPCNAQDWETPPGQLSHAVPCDCKEFDEATSRRRRKPKRYQGTG